MRRVLLWLLGLAVLVPVGAVGAFAVLVESGMVASRAADAVRRATGRELVIAGPIGLTWSLTPTIALRDVSLSNPPGMSRPEMARLARIEAQVDLLALLSRRVEVRSITLVEPDVLLERDAAGRPNWVFASPAPPPSDAPAPSGPPAARLDIQVDAVRLRDGRFGYGGLDARVPSLTAGASSPTDPVALSGTLVLAGTAFELRGTTGPLAGAGAPGWPVRASLVGGGVRAAVDGVAGDLGLTAEIADLAEAGRAVGRALPPVQDVRVSGRIGPAGPSGIEARAGAGDLSAWVPGLRLTRMGLAAPGMAQAVTMSAEFLVGDAPVAVAANAGSLGAMLGGGPVPVQVLLAAAGATVGGQGSVADLTGRGLELSVSARVPDLAALGALGGVALPGLRDVSLETRASMTGAGVALRALRVATSQGDVAGDVVLGWQPRPSLRGTLVSQRLLVDGWIPVARAPAPAPATTTVPAAPGPAPAASVAPRLLSDAPLPFAALRRVDADLRIVMNEAVWRGSSFRTVEGRVLLQDGKLRLDPVQAQGPGGGVLALVLVDAAVPVPTVAFGLRAPGLAAGPLLAAFGAPEGTSGRVDADLQLKGEGASLRALAATLDGYVGLAMVEGELDNRWLTGLLGEALRNVPVNLGGRSAIRCLALRFDVAAGQAVARALLLDATRLRLEGEGGLNLVDESLDLRLQALVRLGATAVGVPVHLTGPWRAPRPQVAGPGGALVIGAPPGADTCPAQLVLARNGRPGPPPAAAPEPSRQPADLLRRLLR